MSYVKISGLQKLTLLDYPEHTACTLFVPGCNFRCPYCHNSELLAPQSEFYDEGEIFAFLKKRAGVLEGVCITGGEPTMYSDIGRLIRDIRALGYLVKLDTNGYEPDRLRELTDAHLLDYIAMDIKNSPSRYAETVGLSPDKLDMRRISRSIETVKTCGADYEFRTTVSAELFDEESIAGAAELVAGAKRYFLQAFVMRDTVPSKTLTAPSPEQMKKYAEIARRYVESVAVRGVDV